MHSAVRVLTNESQNHPKTEWAALGEKKLPLMGDVQASVLPGSGSDAKEEVEEWVSDP